jgi:hypothetical protein
VSEDKMKSAQREFAQWFASNYPGPDTIIRDPFWHAPKIFRAAIAHFQRAMDDGQPAPSVEQDERGADTGNPEADRIIGGLSSSDPDFDDCIDAVAFIRKLVAEHKGPDGFATWKDAALAERMRRKSANVAQGITTRTAQMIEQEGFSPEDVVAIRSEQARDAELLRGLLSHCWEFKTSFDKQSQPTAIRATFKVTTINSEAMAESARTMIADFMANVKEPK